MSKIREQLERVKEINVRNDDRWRERVELEFLEAYTRRRLREVRLMVLPPSKEWWRQMMIELYEYDLAKWFTK